MNKKEITEIKKQFSDDNCAISRICSCFVDGEKQRFPQMKQQFLSLSEDERFKYYEIFKKAFSGTLGKNLINMDFPLDSEFEDGTQAFLLKLRNDRAEDDILLDTFYERVVSTCPIAGNYLIILIFAAYDVPGKASDGTTMDDASDNVYEYMQCTICPVELSKSGLSYNAEANLIQERTRDWVVQLPEIGFLFPVFQDRTADIHRTLYYSKNAETLQYDFASNLLGCELPLTAKTQKGTFQAIVEETLGEECSYEMVKNIHETLNEMIEENKEQLEPLVLSKPEVRTILEKSGVKEEQMVNFERDFDKTAGEKTVLVASNVANTKAFEVKTPDVVIKVTPEMADLLETKLIDGRKCLVIPMEEQIEVNGILVNS